MMIKEYEFFIPQTTEDYTKLSSIEESKLKNFKEKLKKTNIVKRVNEIGEEEIFYIKELQVDEFLAFANIDHTNNKKIIVYYDTVDFFKEFLK